MKINNLPFILLIQLVFATGLMSQTSITLTFTATCNGLHQPLDSVVIENLTQGGDTVLIYPDTVLLLEHGIGVFNPYRNQSEGLILYPSFPNPFTGRTTARFFLPERDVVNIRVLDLLGREVGTYQQSLHEGEHTLTLYPGSERYYLLVVETPRYKRVQKLINLRGGSTFRIEYSGSDQGITWFRLGGKSVFLWAPGDQLRFIGFAAAGVDTIFDNPGQSHSYVFQIPLLQPVADFMVSDSTVQINDTVFFTDMSTGYPANWKWYFGDGDSSQQQHPTKTYLQMGIYTVTLIVSNPAGSDTIIRHNLMTVGSGGPGNPCPGMPVVSDYNGNVYNTVQIGTQCWMRENLQARNYNNGDTIPNITSNSTWAFLMTGIRCWYNNDSAWYAATYGALYNWYAVDNASGLCPTGWHVPSNAEWTILTDFLGGLSLAGMPLKETGTTHWSSPNTGATNSSGFTALPGGKRDSNDGHFENIGQYGGWWSSSSYGSVVAWARLLSYAYGGVYTGSSNQRNGYSVRCIKD